MNAIVPVGANALMPTDMDQAIRLAKAMSTAKMLPKHLWDDVGTCLMIVEQAMRWNMSPFAVAQCTSSIGGKLMYEGKLLAAAAESVGAIEGHFDYEFAGEGEERQVTISARRRGDTSPRQMTIKLKDVRTTNEHWKKQPDQQLVYSGNRNWTRRFTPSVILGNYAPEEYNRDGKPAVADEFEGPTIDAEPEAPSPDARDALNAAVPLKAAAAEMPRGDRVSERVPTNEPPPDRPRNGRAPTRGYREILADLRHNLANAQSAEEVDVIMRSEEILKAKEVFKHDALQELNALLTEASLKWWHDSPDDDPELPEVEIIGERKMASG